jgi:hypothetical protein
MIVTRDVLVAVYDSIDFHVLGDVWMSKLLTFAVRKNVLSTDHALEERMT